jgi:DNA-binding HxlR family transcriptional regulator
MKAYKVTGTRHGYSVARYVRGLMEALETWNAWIREGREDVRLERVAGYQAS